MGSTTSVKQRFSDLDDQVPSFREIHLAPVASAQYQLATKFMADLSGTPVFSPQSLPNLDQDNDRSTNPNSFIQSSKQASHPQLEEFRTNQKGILKKKRKNNYSNEQKQSEGRKVHFSEQLKQFKFYHEAQPKITLREMCSGLRKPISTQKLI